MVNIGVWFTEQLVDIQFEFLSISYIISELFLLGVHLLVVENHRLHQLVVDAHTVQNFIPADIAAAEQLLTAPPPQTLAERERLELFIAGQERLTPTEKAIFDLYIARADSKEVMLALNITQNTLKFHNKNIYSKLGVTSRRELQEVYNQLNTLKQTIANEADTNQ
ncbi:MAG: hypothetical protein IKM70_07440 [Firmicutes bacterium]|nr:hypothetical protein [Bacillota bacterium]